MIHSCRQVREVTRHVGRSWVICCRGTIHWEVGGGASWVGKELFPWGSRMDQCNLPRSPEKETLKRLLGGQGRQKQGAKRSKQVKRWPAARPRKLAASTLQPYSNICKHDQACERGKTSWQREANESTAREAVGSQWRSCKHPNKSLIALTTKQ